MSKVIIDDKIKQSIESVISKGDRVEVIPVKDGIKVVRIRRETVNFDERSSIEQ